GDAIVVFCIAFRPPRRTTLFPYTTLFRSEALDQLGAVDVDDAGAAVGVGGVDRQLPALPGPGVDAHPFEHDGEKARGHLLAGGRSEEHTSELQSRGHVVCRLLVEKKTLSP